MEIAFLFRTIENGKERNLMARLHGIIPGKYILAIPKGKNSPALMADFMDKCPGVSVEEINKSFKPADLIFLKTEDVYPNELVEEICNAINDVFDTDVSISRQISSDFLPFS